VNTEALTDLLGELMRAPLDLLWAGIAWLLDALHGETPWTMASITLGALGVAGGLAWGLQNRLNRRIKDDPDRTHSWLQLARLEARHAFALLPILPVWGLFLLLGALWRLLVRLVRWIGRRGHHRSDPNESSDGTDRKSAAERPILVATLGPSYLLAGIGTAVLYALSRLAEPLIAVRLDLSPGFSAWEFLLLGSRPELAWYLPLQRFPYLAALLTTWLWLAVWSLLSSAIRLVHHDSLGRNLHESVTEARVPRIWPQWFATRSAHEPALAYRRWARWPLLVSIPLFAWAWFSLAGDPYRLQPSELAVGMVLWLSWGLHVDGIRGSRRDPKRTEADDRVSDHRRNGWQEVLEALRADRHLERPEPFETRPALALTQGSPGRRNARILSPLVEELLQRAIDPSGPSGEDAGAAAPASRLTMMQREILTTLALQGYVHTEPPVNLDRLELGPAETEALQDRSGLRSRHQVVLSPEGTGKSTLALLAVTNHALIHTKTSLVVVSTAKRADELHDLFRRALDPSTLRWNVRVRRPGRDLMTDLTRGIVPDVLVTDLHDLVVTLLERTESFDPFFVRLGLVVVDDIESFSGPTEVHAQLAFRRLMWLVEQRTEAGELGGRDKAGPQLLALGVDGMHGISEWAQSLCGVDFAPRRFGVEEESAAAAVHETYRLRDFRTETGDHLLIEDLVAACERLEVPWHYRLCGDGRRDQGRGPLLLPEEPLHFTPSPAAACVLFLEGTWSEVQRERHRLRRAGTRFVETPGGPEKPEPIAFVTLVEPDAEMALTQLDDRFPLSPVLASLPRPVIRPPTGLAVHAHLAADLTQHWVEVEDVLRVFGEQTARTLQRLARENLLLADRRPDILPKANQYVNRVHVQAIARAVAPVGVRVDELPGGILPPKVGQVELVSPATIEVRDRTSLVTLARVDAGAAHLLYYPGRIFQDARGTFVVVERASDASKNGAATGGRQDGVEAGDILAEPILTDSVSTPRRRFEIEKLERGGSEEIRQAAGGAFFGPDRFVLGRHPIRLSLEPVSVTVEHIGTYWVGPIHCEVRQRTLHDTRRTGTAPRLRTVGLFILPNPPLRAPDPEDATDERPPQLTLGAARLLTAAIRAVIPNLYRGGADSLGVALHLESHDGAPGDDDELGPEEGVALFDLSDGGNGTARAIHRDGVDLLLRLSRLVIERVLSLHRLLALHDQWGSSEEIEAEGRAEQKRGEDLKKLAEHRSELYAKRRRQLLDWLESRLGREGGAEAQQELARQFGSGMEDGQDGVIDLGRCWYSQDGSVGDLLWVKHRWQRPGSGEATLDIGFDRKTLASARAVLDREEHRRRAELDRDFERHLEGSGPGASAGRHHTTIQRIWYLGPDSRPTQAEVPDDVDRFKEIRQSAWIGLIEAAGPLGSLVDHLKSAFERLPTDRESTRPADLVELFACFVQGIPTAPPPTDRSQLLEPRPPVETLLQRSGDGGSKSLLLATLLARAGLRTGLFVSEEEQRILAGAPGSATDVPPPALWATVGQDTLVPIDTTHVLRPGRVVVREPKTWAFIPLFLDLEETRSDQDAERDDEQTEPEGEDDAEG